MRQFIPDRIAEWMKNNWAAILFALIFALWGGILTSNSTNGMQWLSMCALLMPFGFMSNLMEPIVNIWPQGSGLSFLIAGFTIGWILTRMWRWKSWMPYVLMAAFMLNAFVFLIWFVGQLNID